MQRLLGAFTAAMFLGFALITLRDALSVGGGWLVARGFILVVMAAATALIVMRERWSLGRLRLVEALVFVTVTLYLAARTYAVGVADLNAGSASWTSTLLGFGLLMIAYGIFVPNPLGRAITGIALIGATPLVSVFLLRANNPELQAAFDATATGRLFETGLLLGTSAAVAIFAAFLTFSLFTFAFDQRKRTFYDLEERIGSGGMGEVW
ncbi:MAG: hypothetical protein IH849_09245 [Acidobacteria bacterium]|nr:hypothetical protein [Acidobacteriota bacterium]